MHGMIDEVRVSSTARSADWITAEYNNQSSPSTFYSVGSASGGGGGVSLAAVNLSPLSGSVGTSVTITGSAFGSTQGSSTVTFNGTTATPTSWSNTSIVVPVPSGATNGNVVVTVAGTASNGLPYNVGGGSGNPTTTRTLCYGYDINNRLTQIVLGCTGFTLQSTGSYAPQIAVLTGGTVLSTFTYDSEANSTLAATATNLVGEMVTASNNGYTWHYSYDIMGRDHANAGDRHAGSQRQLDGASRVQI
jgi:hypothetical protein